MSTSYVIENAPLFFPATREESLVSFNTHRTLLSDFLSRSIRGHRVSFADGAAIRDQNDAPGKLSSWLEDLGGSRGETGN